MNTKTRNITLIVIFLLAMSGELLLQTYYQNAFGNYRSPAIWLICGLTGSFAAWALVNSKTEKIKSINENASSKHFLAFGVYAVMAISFAYHLSGIFADFEINPKNSDIIPCIQLYVTRFLSGEFPYKPLVFDGWTVLSTYFPMTWLPFTFSEILDIDYRWTAYLVFLTSLGLYINKISKQGISAGELIFKIILPFVLLFTFASYSPEVFGHSVELLPIGFYLFLCYCLFNPKSQLLFALGITLCLMSRYAFTLWLPLAMVIYWIEYGFKSAFKVGLYVLAGVMLIYVIPFLSKNWSLISDGLEYYALTAIRQWSIQDWQEVGEKPYHLFRGLSFSGWFYDNIPGDPIDKMNAAKKVHLLVSVTAAALLAIGYFIGKKYKEDFNVRMYLMIGLKFYLIVFYGFIYVPFSYLFMLPLFISLPIIYEIPLSKSSISVKN